MAQSRNYSYGISLSSKLASIAGNVEIGRALVFSDVDDGFVIATAANRAALGNRSTYGIALTPGNSTQPLLAPPVVEMLAEGLLVKEISALGPGAKCFVRVNDNGWLERVVSPAPSDDVIGTCETNGDVHIRCGGFAVSSTLTTLGTALQILRTNAAATATEWWTLVVNLATQVAGILAVTNGGTGLGALGSALQILRVNAAATALEYWTLVVNLATQVTGLLPLANLTPGTNGQYLQTSGGVAAWASPGGNSTVAIASGGFITWGSIANANVAGGAAIDTSKLALPGSASEVFYRGAGPVIAAAAKTSIASDGSLQVGASGWATIGNIRHPKGSSVYARNAANSADLAVWELNAASDRLFVGTNGSQTAAKTFDYAVINAISYAELGVAADPSAPTADDGYMFFKAASNFGDAIGGSFFQGRLALRTVSGAVSSAFWGGGGRGCVHIGLTPTEPSATTSLGSILWSWTGGALKHQSHGGIINQLSQGQARIGITHTTAARTLTAAEIAPFEITIFLVTGVLDGACALTWPTPTNDTDGYSRIVFYDAPAHQPNITHQLASGLTVTQKPGSSIIMSVDTTYGIRLSSGLGGVSVSGAATYTAAAGTSTEFQVNDGFGVLAAASNVLYVGGKLQTATNLQWLNGLIKGDLAWAPTLSDKTLTLPNATDTLVGKATTDVLTNKTFDTAGAGNSLLINGVAATDNTGTGKVVRDTSPTIVTPAITTSATITKDGIGFAVVDALIVQNTTAATGGATVQAAPAIDIRGAAWKSNATAVSQAVNWKIVNLPNSGAAAATATIYFGYSIAGAAYTYPVTINSSGTTLAVAGSGSYSGALSVSGTTTLGSATGLLKEVSGVVSAISGSGVPVLASGVVSLLTGFDVVRIVQYTANGTHTTSSDCTQCVLIGCGGGGQGGGGGRGTNGNTGQPAGGQGGGGSENSSLVVVVTASTGYTVTIGAGGTSTNGAAASNTAGTAGADGGDTTFGSLATFVGAGGGSGGIASAAIANNISVQNSNRRISAMGSLAVGVASTVLNLFDLVPSLGGRSGIPLSGAGIAGNAGNYSRAGFAGGAGGAAGTGLLGTTPNGGGGGGGGALGAGAAGGAGGATGATTPTAGSAGSAASANTGAGGGGGGGGGCHSGQNSANGGDGGAGGSGVLWVIELRAVA